MELVTWKELIEEEMKVNGEVYDDIRHVQVDSEDKKWDHLKFIQSYGMHQGASFVAYTDNYIYFPTTYDGYEECCSLPRHPNPNWKPRHFGGE